MKKIILAVTLFLLSSISMANELQTREDINKQVKELVLNQKYSELEVMAEKFREDELRTSSGLWMLTLFYGAIGEINRHNKKDPEAWIGLRKNVDSWMSKYPNSPTPYIAKSIILKDEAWSIRGNGYSSSVKPESWKPFHKKVEESRVVLEDSIDVSSQDPHWYVVMTNIATIQSWKEDKFESLIKNGLTKNQYYFQLYFDVMNYYTPRWHGSAEKIEAFANQAADRTKEKEGAGMYARIYWAASQVHFEGRIFENSDVRWEVMSKGISDVLKKYPDQWNINNFALFSCLAKDKEKTKELISMINASPIRDGWLGNIKNYEYCKNWSLQ
jgi:hypothetical protein